MTPVENSDCANKRYVDDISQMLSDRLSEEIRLTAESTVDKSVNKVIDIIEKEILVKSVTIQPPPLR